MEAAAVGLIGILVGALLTHVLSERSADRAAQRSRMAERRAWSRAKFDDAAGSLGAILKVLKIDPMTMISFAEEDDDALTVWLGYVERINEAVRELRFLRAHPSEDVREAARRLFDLTPQLQASTLGIRFHTGTVNHDDVSSAWYGSQKAAERLLETLLRATAD